MKGGRNAFVWELKWLTVFVCISIECAKRELLRETCVANKILNIFHLLRWEIVCVWENRSLPHSISDRIIQNQIKNVCARTCVPYYDLWRLVKLYQDIESGWIERECGQSFDNLIIIRVECGKCNFHFGKLTQNKRVCLFDCVLEAWKVNHTHPQVTRPSQSFSQFQNKILNAICLSSIRFGHTFGYFCSICSFERWERVCLRLRHSASLFMTEWINHSGLVLSAQCASKIYRSVLDFLSNFGFIKYWTSQ